MKRAVSLITMCSVASLCAAPLAHARPRTHDGFLLRLTLGLGYENLSLDDGVGTTVGVGGLGGGASIGIGGMVIPNLAINADIFASTVVSPNASQNGVDLGTAANTKVGLSGIGVGATYYVMPVNLYLAASVGVAQSWLTVQGADFASNAGLAVRAAVGKEFWVGSEWGLGVAGEFTYADVPARSDAASASFISANVVFTATFN